MGGARPGRGHTQKVPFKKGPKKVEKTKYVPVSKRIRDVKRLLNKPDLDAAVKVASEKKLVALLEEFEQRKRAELERKYAVKYHKVRFFERVKLERRLGKLKRQQEKAALGAGPGLTSEQEIELRQAEDDLQYVLNFPKGEKYISILKNAEEPEAQAHLETERSRLRALVKQQLAEAALLGEADEGRSLAAANEAGAADRKQRTAGAAAGVKRKADAFLLDGAGKKANDEGADGEEKDDFFLFGSEEEQSDQEEEPGSDFEDEEQEVPSNGRGAGTTRVQIPKQTNSISEEDDEEAESDSRIEGEEGSELSEDAPSSSGGGESTSEEEEERQGKEKGLPYTKDGSFGEFRQHGNERRDQGFPGRGRGGSRGRGGPGRGGGGSAGRGRGGPMDRNYANYEKKPFAKAPFTAPKIGAAGVGKPGHVAKSPAAIKPAENQPQRKRAEGGRKRRK